MTLGDTRETKVGLKVEPGICGFSCEVQASQVARDKVKIEVKDSQCAQIKKLQGEISILEMKDIFVPPHKNNVFIMAAKARCHASCLVPVAILKAAEVALGLALPKDAKIEVNQSDKGGVL